MEAMRHETGGKVVMNCACHSDGRKYYLVSGQESHCQLYNVSISVTNEAELIDSKLAYQCGILIHSNSMVLIADEEQNVDGRVRKRKGSKNGMQNGKPQKVDNNSNSFKKLMFKLAVGDSIQTDFL